ANSPFTLRLLHCSHRFHINSTKAEVCFPCFRIRIEAMATEAYAARNPDEIHTDVLSSSRQACYKARDAFYACLEKESDKKQTEIASKGLLYPAECKASREEFVNHCRASWVKHFDALYCKNKSLKRLLDDKDSRRGPLSLPQPYTFKPTTSS
ncbi:unnamed protein product, partial [Prunus brigantina]